MNAFRDEVRTIKKKHARTATWTDLFTEDVDPVNYGDRLFDRIVHKLDQAQLQTAHMIIQHYEWLLPRVHATPEQLAVYDAVSHRALTVTNDELALIMKLEPSTTSSPPTTQGQHY